MRYVVWYAIHAHISIYTEIMKTIKNYLPELYFLFAILYYWSLTALVFNWFAIGLLITLGLLILTKMKRLGIILGIVIISINLYLCLALFSELMEFETFNGDALKLLALGSLFLGLNIVFGGLLCIKYAKQLTKETINITN